MFICHILILALIGISRHKPPNLNSLDIDDVAIQQLQFSCATVYRTYPSSHTQGVGSSAPIDKVMVSLFCTASGYPFFLTVVTFT